MASTNWMVLAVAFAVVCIFIQSASSQVPGVCPFYIESERQAIINECTGSDPDLKEIITILLSSQSQSRLPELMDKVCQQPDAVAKALGCLVDKAKPCIPVFPGTTARETLITLLPDEERLKKAFGEICENRGNITQADVNCFRPHQDAISACVQRDIAAKIRDVDGNNPKAVKNAVCSIVDGAKGCIEVYKGTCSEAMVKTTEGVLTIFNPCNGAAPIGVTILLLAAAVFLSLFNSKMF